MQPKGILLSFSKYAPITMFECECPKVYQKTLISLVKVECFTPQGVYLKSTSKTVQETGILILPGGEKQPLYSGAYLQDPKDVLYWSINFSAQLCSPADFNL